MSVGHVQYHPEEVAMHLSPSERRTHESYEYAREAEAEGPGTEESCGACERPMAEDEGVRLEGDWCCAACVLQVASERALDGWATRPEIERNQILAAVEQAVAVLR